jgi:hypothetical protein
MRILSFALIFRFVISILILSTSQARADGVCGVFKATVYVPPDGNGAYVLASPKAVSKTRLNLEGGIKLPTQYIDRLVQIEFRSKSVCYRECNVEFVKADRLITPFEPFGPYTRSSDDLVKSEPCQKTPMEAIGL